MGAHAIAHGDVLAVLRELPSNEFDACLCDPPYELSNDGKASAIRVALEFLFPEVPLVDSDRANGDVLPLLVAKVLRLACVGFIPCPSAAVPVRPLALHRDPSHWQDDVNDMGKSAVWTPDSDAGLDLEAESTEHLGCFSFKCADPVAMHKALDRVGTGFLAGGLGIGLRVDAASLPSLLYGSGAVDVSDEDVGALYDALTLSIGACAGAKAGSVAGTLGFARRDEDLLSARAALALLGALKLGGAKAVRADPGARRLPAKLQARRIRVVADETDWAVTFDVVIHPQNVVTSGFMGKGWDGSKVAFDVETWRELLRVLKPGAPVIAFGGTRTFHRVAVGIEDAGFELRDVLSWMYGCLSEDTEILVDGQWEPYHRATAGRLALCYDMANDEYSWQPIAQLFVYAYDDTAYRIHSDCTDQIVSRNHRCIVERSGAFAFELAEEVAREHEARVPVLEGLSGLLFELPLPYKGAGHSEQDVRQDVLFSLGQSESEGSTFASESQSRRDLHGVRQDIQAFPITKGSGRAFELLPRMQRRAPWCGMGAARAQGEGCVDERVSHRFQEAYDGRDESGLEGWRNGLPKTRQLCRSPVRQVPDVAAVNGAKGRLRDGASVAGGDGHWPAATAGGDSAPRGPRPDEQRANQLVAVREQPRSQAVRASRFTRSDLARIEAFHLTGLVWCVSVPTGAFVARRNGKVFVTGNSGFPKSLDVSKALDKAAGAERTEVIGTGWHHGTGRGEGRTTGAWTENYQAGDAAKGSPVLAPSTPLAQQWAGYGTALKPAWEPAILARKPLEGTVAANVDRYGVGGLAIDACRIGDEPAGWGGGGRGASGTWDDSTCGMKAGEARPVLGRWPANVIMDEEAGAALDAGYGGGGGASRFFYSAKVSTKEREWGCAEIPMRASSEIHGREQDSAGILNPRAGAQGRGGARNHHPTLKPIALARWLARLIMPPTRDAKLLVPFSGAGSEMIGALEAGWPMVFGIEGEEEYVQIAHARIAAWKKGSP